jgi:CheY-like chemotaxis protein
MLGALVKPHHLCAPEVHTLTVSRPPSHPPQLNLDVIEACDGRQGLQAYLQHGRAAIAFVFLDLMMPVCDGFHAALGIRSVESRRGWLPVPLVAYTSEDVRRGSPTWLQCMHAGFNDVVVRHDGGERVWVQGCGCGGRQRQRRRPRAFIPAMQPPWPLL